MRRGQKCEDQGGVSQAGDRQVQKPQGRNTGLSNEKCRASRDRKDEAKEMTYRP